MPAQGACANNGCTAPFCIERVQNRFLTRFMHSSYGKLLLSGCEFYAIDVRLLSKTAGRDLLGVLCSAIESHAAQTQQKTHYGGFQLHEDRFTKTESRRPFRRSDRGTFGGRRRN